jgi:hypothetical protein
VDGRSVDPKWKVELSISVSCVGEGELSLGDERTVRRTAALGREPAGPGVRILSRQSQPAEDLSF